MARTPYNQQEGEDTFQSGQSSTRSYESSDLSSAFNSNKGVPYFGMSAGTVPTEVDENVLDLKGENRSYKGYRK